MTVEVPLARDRPRSRISP